MRKIFGFKEMETRLYCDGRKLYADVRGVNMPWSPTPSGASRVAREGGAELTVKKWVQLRGKRLARTHHDTFEVVDPCSVPPQVVCPFDLEMVKLYTPGLREYWLDGSHDHGGLNYGLEKPLEVVPTARRSFDQAIVIHEQENYNKPLVLWFLSNNHPQLQIAQEFVKRRAKLFSEYYFGCRVLADTRLPIDEIRSIYRLAKNPWGAFEIIRDDEFHLWPGYTRVTEALYAQIGSPDNYRMGPRKSAPNNVVELHLSKPWGSRQ